MLINIDNIQAPQISVQIHAVTTVHADKANKQQKSRKEKIEDIKIENKIKIVI